MTGKDIRAVLADEILDPLGFRWTNYGVAAEDVDAVALNYVTGPPTAPPLSQILTRALGLPFDELVDVSNDERFLTAIVPAANVVTTATSCRASTSSSAAAAGSTAWRSWTPRRFATRSASNRGSRSTCRSASPPASATA